MHTAIRWFAHNPVASNLLMILLLLGGAFGAVVTNQEEFPNFDIQIVTVQVPYLGAAPIEVERSVCVRIEEAIEGVEGIDKLRSTATEGMCNVMAELTQDAEEVSVLNEIKSRVDGINSFPVETETDESVVVFDKFVRMDGHFSFPSCHFSPFVTTA